MLAIEVEFLTGRFIATAYNSRLEPEWPPHPARLFSAMVATHFANESPVLDEREALDWLAIQAPPSISATGAVPREVVTVFVPVNDVALTDVDEEAALLDTARTDLASARKTGEPKAIKKAEATVTKAKSRLDKAIEKSVAIPPKGGNPLSALKVLPEHRTRKPRTFPSVTPDDPRVVYVWPEADPSAALQKTLAGLLARVVRLGHSSSLVAARLVTNPSTVVWRPARDGEKILRVVGRGQVQVLETAHALHKEVEPRVIPARFQAYTTRPSKVHAPVPQSQFSPDWLVFRRVGGPALPMTAAAAVARTLRRALLSHAPASNEVLSGHLDDGRPSEGDHLAIVPLPFIGHARASGAILGVALILPIHCSDDDRGAVFGAVDAWERTQRIEEEDAPRLPVNLGAAGVLEIERVEWEAAQATLQPSTWCRSALVWLSATPVALDRNPGELRASDPRRAALAVGEAEATLRRACERIGLPEPAHVEILPAPPWAGGAKARHYPPFPAMVDRSRRVLTHARIQFRDPVGGPVLLGAGRYQGLGLFRPDPDHD